MYNATQFNFQERRKRTAVITSFARGMNMRADDGVLPLTYAKSTYNFCYNDGALKEGFGLKHFEQLPNGESCEGMFLFRKYNSDMNVRDDRILFFCKSGKIYHRRVEGEQALSLLEGVTLQAKPMAVNYRLYSEDVVIICTEKDAMMVWNGEDEPYFVQDSPHISSMTIHFERLFATVDGEKSSVWFSEDLDPTNWELTLDAGGFIQMVDERGQLNKVVSYLNYVYVFRDYGISRVAAYADQQDFSVSHLFVSGGKIYPQTVTLCGDRILFLAEDGLYAFNGADTYKLLGELDGFFCSNENAVSTYNSGKFYMAVRADFADGQIVGCESQAYVNNVLLVYDITTREVSLMRGVDFSALCCLNLSQGGKVLGAVRDDGRVGEICVCGEVYGQPTQKCWQTPYTDFGIKDRTKLLKSIFIVSECDCEVEVTTDRTRRTFYVAAKQGISQIRCAMPFRQAGFKFTCRQSNARIVQPTVVFSS